MLRIVTVEKDGFMAGNCIACSSENAILAAIVKL